jgi:pyruvate kinase
MIEREGKTRIVCTVGPASSEPGILGDMLLAGMDVARLNFSHGTREEHLHALRSIHEAARRSGVEPAVLQDLQGPKIRVGALSVPSIELTPGSRLIITTDPIVGGPGRIGTTYQGLPRDVHPGADVLLDDGKMRLRVVEVRGNDVICEVAVGGTLSAHKGINLPGVAVSAPSFTDKDLQDLVFGLEQEIDYVALSFVRSAEDIRQLRAAIAAHRSRGRRLPVIAKIEKPQAVANIDEIIAEADGIMIARGDLGVEIPPEDVPIHQKMIIRRCNAAGKPVIVATQMLESMTSSPTPTRAEANDVANAVIDGGDAVMLSGETSVGKYPLETVRMMERIIRKVESERLGPSRAAESRSGIADRHDALGRSACLLAEQMHAAAIVTVTNSGQTARVLARYRPEPPIIALTDSPTTLRLLNIVWGVRGLLVGGLDEDSDHALANVQKHLLASGMVRSGEYIVLLAGQPFFARGSTNFIKVEQVG